MTDLHPAGTGESMVFGRRPCADLGERVGL